MSKLYRIGLIMITIIIFRHSKLHDYAGIMMKHVPHICGIKKYIPHIYAPQISPNFARIFSRIFCFKSSAYFKKILRCKPAFLYFAVTLIAALNCGAGR